MRYFRTSWALLTGGISLLLCPHSHALNPGKAITQYHQDFWGEEDGLPQGSVQAITQTADGYIWIGTRDGLARFDGIKFTIFRGDKYPTLASDDIRCLYQDNLGRLWIGTFNGGVSCYEKGQFRTYSMKDGLPGAGVLEIFQDKNGNIWFGGWGGIARFNRGLFDTFREKEGLVGRNGWSFSQDKQGRMWAATERSIFNYEKGRFQMDTHLCQFRKKNIRKIQIDRNDALWVGTLGDGLIRYNQGNEKTFTTKDGLPDNRVRAIEEDKDGNLWVGTWDGLSRIQGEQVQSLPKTGDKINGVIEALFVDREGSLWIGMRGGGLGRLRDAKFSNLTTREGLLSKLPRSVFQAHDGAIWIGTDGGGLAKFQGNAIQNFTKANGLPSEFVASVGEERDGTIWAGLGRPAAIVAIRSGKVEEIIDSSAGLPFEYSVRAVFVDSSGNRWAGGDGGLCLFSKTNVTKISGLPSNLVRLIAEDKKGNLWVGTDDGLCVLEDKKIVSVFTAKDGLAHSAVYSFLEDQSGTIWLGTQQGLTRLKEGKFHAFKRSEGAFEGSIYQILEDSQGLLWTASSRGIETLKKDQVNDVADGRKSFIEPVIFGTADGLKSTQCSGGSMAPGCKSSDGRLWFATLKGVAIVQPEEPEPMAAAPPVLLEELKADHLFLDPLQEHEFRADADDFEFHYTALRFITPEKAQFRYRLEGHDKDWIDAGTRRAAYYSNLRPGKYTFQVAASNDGVTWSTPSESSPFILPPHFYQTLWFYSISAAAIVVVGWSFHRNRMRQAREQFSLILAERTRIARDLHDTLAQGFAGTAFQLEALGSNLSDASPETKRHLDLALTMVRHSLSEAKHAVMNLRSPLLENTDLVTAVSHVGEQMLVDTGIKLTIETRGKASKLGAKVENELLHICQEALANVLKHAKASEIRIVFDFSAAIPCLIIRDNGSGFDLGDANGTNGFHFGLHGMKERVKQLGGELKIKTQPGSGTEICICLNQTHAENGKHSSLNC